MKRIACIIILLSMTLHCASRLGILSYLYQKRHHIAHAIGLIAEVPIAMCSSDYHFDKNLIIHDASEEAQEREPAGLAPASEIVLFVQPIATAISSIPITDQSQCSLYVETSYLSPVISIFRPPCNSMSVA